MRIFILITLSFLFICCRQTEYKSRDEVVKIEKIIDTSSITIIPINPKYDWLFENTENANLNADELQQIETLLNEELKRYNKEQQIEFDKVSKKYPNERIEISDFVIELKRYKRQYLPMINELGEKEILINCFCGEWGEVGKTELVMAEDGGNCYFELKINLTKNKVLFLSVNGNA